MSLDRNIRTYAVPVRGTIWGLNYNDRSERDIGYITNLYSSLILSDFHDFFPGFASAGSGIPTSPAIGARRVCPIRILKPHYGGIAECYADLSISVASSDSDLTLKLAIGHMDNDTYERQMNYSSDYIDRSWRKIHGSDDPLVVTGGKIEYDLINLLHAIPQFGQDDYLDDAFVLILSFNKVPTLTGSFKFNYLNVHTSVTGVV